MENRLKAKWAAGEPTFGAWLAIPSPLVAEAVAGAGFDYVCVDMQHGVADYQVAIAMLAAMRSGDTTPIVRVPWNEPGIIGRMLDAGALGIVIPMVNSVAEAQVAVAACRYAPDGARSFGPIRASLVHGPSYYADANREIACIPMIETVQAVDGLEDILAVPGIDAVYIGPADLSITYGLPPGVDNPGTVFDDALAKVVSCCQARGITPGIHGTAAVAEKRVAGGFRMVTVSADLGAVTTGMRADLKQARAGATAGAAAGSGDKIY
jgi:4-hydroxy-2-oxoheptanedioate aldolase